MFGQTQNKGFTFGTGTNAFGTANAASPFGGGAAFGAAATGGGFGAPSTVNKPLFGAGATQQTSTPGLFGTMTGATGATTGNLFGQPATSTSSGFGLGQPVSSTGGLFTTTPMASFAFPAGTALGGGTSTGLFGGGAGLGAASGAASTGTGLFGTAAAPTTTVSSGLFGGGSGGLFGGASAFGANTSTGFAQQQGTTTKFEATPGTDTMMKNGANATVQTKHQCITAMKAYENKSLEELRMEDYSVGRKGPQPGAVGTIFNAGASQQAQAPQQQAFGFPSASTGFTSGNTSMFGQTPAGTTSALFGGAPTVTQSVGSFGTSTSQSLFGNQSQTPLFGGTNTLNKPLFGQTTTTASSNMFGSGTAPAFGTAVTPFGTTPGGGTTSLGLLGSSVAKQPFNLGTATSTAGAFPNFGTTAPTSGMFPSMTNSQPAGGMFGQGGATSTTGSFGFPAMANTGSTTGFGSLTQPQLQNKPFGFNSTFPMLGGSTAGGTSLGSTMGIGNMPGFSMSGVQPQPSTVSALPFDNGRDAAVQQQLQTQMVAMTNSPYGDSPLFRSMSRERAEKAGITSPTDPAALKAVLSNSQLKVTPRPLSKLMPRPLTSMASLGTRKKSDLFDGLEEDLSFGSDSFVPRNKSVKKLSIVDNGGSRRTSLTSGSLRDDDDISVLTPTNPVTASSAVQRKQDDASGSKDKEYETLNLGPSPKQVEVDVTEYDGAHADDTIANLNIRNRQRESLKADPVPLLDHSTDRSSTPEQDEESRVEVPVHPAGIKLTRSDYYTIPSFDEIAKMVDDNGDCFVKDFTIGRKGYGSLFFPGMTNVAGLDLDEIVHFRRKEVTVYPDDNAKPPHGTGLNKKAEVTLHCVWPTDKSTHSPIQDVERLKTMEYPEKVEQATFKLGAKFVDYRPETGSWVFEVKHFSKYGLLDESDEDEAERVADHKKLRPLQQKDLNCQAAAQAGEASGATKTAPGPQQRQQPAKQPNETSPGSEDQSDLENDDVCLLTPAADRKSLLPASEDFDDDSDDIYSGAAGQLEHSPHMPTSQRIAGRFGIRSETIQRMKASFFDDDDDEGHDRMDWKAGTGGLLKAATVKSSIEPSGSSLVAVSQPPHRAVSGSGDSSSSSVAVGSGGPTVARLATMPSQLELPEPDYPLLSTGTDTGREAAGPSCSWRPTVADMAASSILPYQESTLFTTGPCLVDASTFMGRRCRAGWGPGNVLVHCGAPLGPATSADQGMDIGGSASPNSNATGKAGLSLTPYRVVVEQVHSRTCNKSDILQFTEENALKIQLGHSLRSNNTPDADLPFLAPMEGVAALHAYVQQILNDFDECAADDPAVSKLRHWVLVWELCSVLWGQLPELPSSDASEPVTEPSLPYEEQHARREAFSRWLAYAASQTRTAGAHRDSHYSKADDSVEQVFSRLAAGSVLGACQAAVASGDHRLALLLAQAGSSQAVKHLVQRQLADWRHSETDRFIAERRLKVFALLAGHMLWPTSRHDPDSMDAGFATLINVCEDLDWKQALAVHFWYACPSSAGIRLAVEAYDAAACKGSNSSKSARDVGKVNEWAGLSKGSYAAPPLPPYLEEQGGLVEEAARETTAKDTCYHILKLYCDRAYRIDRILNPLTWTDDPLDYQLSWHLMSVLEALGYGSQLTATCRVAVHMRYADQLEAAGLWHWAAFVLLHVKDAHRRAWAVRSLLSRHVLLDSEPCSDAYADREQFVVRELGIPAKFLHEAKATRALRLHRFDELCTHLIKSGQPSAAHDVLLQHVAPALIVREDYVTLKEMLTEVTKAGDVAGWDKGGRIYLDYVNILESLEHMGRRQCSMGELHTVQTDVMSLTRRLGNLHCPTAQHRLSQAEMAKRLAVLLRMLLSSQSARRDHLSTTGDTSISSVKQLAPYLSLLPLPEDDSLQELRNLVMAYNVEFAT